MEWNTIKFWCNSKITLHRLDTYSPFLQPYIITQIWKPKMLKCSVVLVANSVKNQYVFPGAKQAGLNKHHGRHTAINFQTVFLPVLWILQNFTQNRQTGAGYFFPQQRLKNLRSIFFIFITRIYRNKKNSDRTCWKNLIFTKSKD